MDYEDLIDPEKFLIIKEELLHLDRLLKVLTPREELVIRRLYGIGHEVKTATDIAKDFSVTKQRIVKIRDRALCKLLGKKPEYPKKKRKFTINVIVEDFYLGEDSNRYYFGNRMINKFLYKKDYPSLWFYMQKVNPGTLTRISRFKKCIKVEIDESVNYTGKPISVSSES